MAMAAYKASSDFVIQYIWINYNDNFFFFEKSVLILFIVETAYVGLHEMKRERFWHAHKIFEDISVVIQSLMEIKIWRDYVAKERRFKKINPWKVSFEGKSLNDLVLKIVESPLVLT